MLEVVIFSLSLVGVGVLLFIQLYALIMYSDLESDYIGPIDLCERLDVWVVPEYGLQALITGLMLLGGHWLPLVVNGALTAYHYWKWREGLWRFDATEIFRQLSARKYESIGKIVFYLLLFFYYLYRMILAFIS